MKRDIWKAKHICHNCNIKMVKKKVLIEDMFVRAWECKKCKEIVLHQEDAQKMLIFNKLKQGLPVKIGKLGEALMMRLPKEVIQFYNIGKGEDVILKAESKHRFEVVVS